jgi:hypothetical protein
MKMSFCIILARRAAVLGVKNWSHKEGKIAAFFSEFPGSVFWVSYPMMFPSKQP